MPTRRDLANAIRALSMDAVQQANSGHPGMPMGMADIAEVLWNDYLSHNPDNPRWDDRDRFVLSNGHGSMLIYSLLHLSGYDLPMDELRRFRQLGSKTPGHPESHLTPGVETTTGPLGQGLANAVGLALAEKVLAAHYNRPGFAIVDHYTYVFAGDGCLMEGISHEACSLAGTWKLGKLICFYDDNGISIDGEVQGWFSENTPMRFEAYGWHVIDNVDGHDPDAVRRAIEVAHAVRDKPTIICCRTVIGYGSPNKQGTASSHGSPIGTDEVAATREALGWHHPPFEIPSDIAAAWDGRERGAAAEKQWDLLLKEYRTRYPDLAAEYCRRMAGEMPDGWAGQVEDFIREVADENPALPTRKASLKALNFIGPRLPELIGGSADLTGSNLTLWDGATTITGDEPDGNYLHFGVREFGMMAIVNGLALHGGFIPYGGTFLMFSDYARNAIRMAALMGIPSIHVYSHDSIGQGEDGPTHQPVEHLTSLRVIPNIEVWRPADAIESAVAWRHAVERRDGPVLLVTSRQGLPALQHAAADIPMISRGGYVISDCDGTPEVIIIATGSEVALAVEAGSEWTARGHAVRVVSMPCTNVFDRQDEAYRESVLPSAVTRRVAVEAGATATWRAYVGAEGRVVGLDRFGESAPGKDLFVHFGFTAQHVLEVLEALDS